MTIAQGQIINHHYRIVKLLGQGGFGCVYKVWDLNTQIVYAIKENLDLAPENQRQFLREATLLHALHHPNLPQVKEYFIVPGQGQYLVMDYIDGQDLEELRKAAGGKLPESQVIPWISQVCDALIYLHSQYPPIIHRDIKPANIKITHDGKAMLVDFGIAKIFNPLQKTTLGARAVTPGYTPVEQYGIGKTDTRTDIYALGATLYTLLTGQEPLESPVRVMNDQLQSPHQLTPEISAQLENIILQALQIKPEQRFRSIRELKIALSSAKYDKTTTPFNQTIRDTTNLIPKHSPTVAITQSISLRVKQRFARIAKKQVGIYLGVIIGLLLLGYIAFRMNTSGDNPLLGIAVNRLSTMTMTPTIQDSRVAILPSFTNISTLAPKLSAPTIAMTPLRRSLQITQDYETQSSQQNSLSAEKNKTTIISATVTAPPDNAIPRGKIAFTCQVYDDEGRNQICIINPDGSGFQQLTDISSNYYPSISPDGNSVIFVSFRTKHWEIFELNLNNNILKQITAENSEFSGPEISPNGQYIVATKNSDNIQQIWLMNRDGSNLHRVFGMNVDCLDPTWSPDGKKILFACGNDRENRHLMIMNSDGTSVYPVNNNFSTRGRSDWSNDGTTIIGYHNLSPNRELYTLNIDGTNLKQLTNGWNDPSLTYGNSQAPSFSPNGQWVTFTAYPDLNLVSSSSPFCEIYIIKIDGTNVQRLTNNDYCDYQPRWGP